MLLRSILLLVSGYMFSDFYDYKYVQKLLESINSPLAIDIPIESLLTQILILVGLFFSSPVILLGSKNIREWIQNRTFFLCFFVCSIFLVSHLLLLTIGYQGVENIIEGQYREKALEGCALFFVALIFSLTDFIRFSISARNSRHFIFD